MAQESQPTDTTSKVRRITPEELAARFQPQQQSQPAKRLACFAQAKSTRTQVLAMITAIMATIGTLLAARLAFGAINFLGAFALAYLTVQNPDQMKLIGTLIYDIFVLGPLVYLTIHKA